jgi:hypothetical protein
MNDTGLIELQHLDLQSLELPHLESAPISAASATLEQNPEMGNGLGSETIAALAHDDHGPRPLLRPS